jgi:hypothetical protein
MSDMKIEDVYAQLNITKILVAAIESLGQLSLPVEKFLNATNEDKELQVDYNEDDQTFTFKLKQKD